MRKIVFLILILFITSCSSEILELPEPDGYLNHPIGICGVTDGTNYYLLVTNSNYGLAARTGTISVIGLAPQYTSPTIIPEKAIVIESFTGNIVYSATQSLAFVANREGDSVDIFSVTGMDSDITISEHSTSAITVGENPYGLFLLESGTVSDRLFVTNMTDGTVSVITLADFAKLTIENVLSSDKEDIELDITGESLISRGIGASRIGLTPAKDLALVTSTSSNTVFVINVEKNEVEGFIYLDSEKGESGSGSRGIKVSSTGIAYVANRNTDSIYIIDTSRIPKNNISNDVIDDTIVGIIPLEGDNPSDIALSTNEDYLYVAMFSTDKIMIVDLSNNSILDKIDAGDGPINMAVANGKVYVTNFYDSTITVVDITTNIKESDIANP